MRQNVYRALELIETAKKNLSYACMEKEISFEEWNKINNHLENAHISTVRAINNDTLKHERECV